jgi:hypothetical protein
MNQREVERLERESILTLRFNDDLKEQVINRCLNELNKVVKMNVKKKDLVIFVMTS